MVANPYSSVLTVEWLASADALPPVNNINPSFGPDRIVNAAGWLSALAAAHARVPTVGAFVWKNIPPFPCHETKTSADATALPPLVPPTMRTWLL